MGNSSIKNMALHSSAHLQHVAMVFSKRKRHLHLQRFKFHKQRRQLTLKTQLSKCMFHVRDVLNGHNTKLCTSEFEDCRHTENPLRQVARHPSCNVFSQKLSCPPWNGSKDWASGGCLSMFSRASLARSATYHTNRAGIEPRKGDILSKILKLPGLQTRGF